MKIKIDKKSFNVLRRITQDGEMPNSKFDYGNKVGDGLRSSSIVAPALWVARNLPEAPIAIEDQDGELITDHDMARLWNLPNAYYTGSDMTFAIGFDYSITGNAYVEIDRGQGRRPVALYYQPSTCIKPKGTKETLITHYEQSGAGTIPRRIEVEDMIHIRFGIDPRDQKLGYAPIQCLLREVFTDDEAAAFTAAVLRNMGFPGVIISPADEGDTFGPKIRKRFQQYFRKMFRGDQRGDVMTVGGRVKIDTLDVDLSKINLDKLRQIPEERVCAVLGIPASVVGFGTGMEQTKVGATLSELRELAHENVIVPTWRTIARTLTNKLLPEFDTNDNHRVTHDLRNVRVLQEDENKRSVRITNEWQKGVILRSEARQTLGLEANQGDDVYLSRTTEIFIPASGQMSADGKSWRKSYKARSEQGLALIAQFDKDVEALYPIFEAELVKFFDGIGEELTRAWEEQSALVGVASNGNGQRKVLNPREQAVLDQILLAYDMPEPPYEDHYLRMLEKTVDTINTRMGLTVMLDEPMEREVLRAAGTQKGLIDLTEQTKDAMYEAIAEAREQGLGPYQTARTLRDKISAGPHWNTVETRANVIARTETKYAQNVSSMEVYKSAENVTHIEIFDARAEPPHTDNCLSLDGQTMSVEEASMIPYLDHPNCSRSFAPIVGGA